MYPGTSIAMLGATLSAVSRWADSNQGSLWWWIPTWRIFEDAGRLTGVGLGIMVVALVLLGRGIMLRSHAYFALATLVSAYLVYVVMLDLWMQRPGPFVDPRMVYTAGFARVPLYVSVLALVGHIYLWINARWF